MGPCPRLHESRLFARTTGGGGLLRQRDCSASLHCAQGDTRGMGKGDGSLSPSSRGQAIREDTGEGVGGRAVREPPLRGVGRIAYNGRPQGSPLQEKDGGHGGVGKGGWVPASARAWERGMGPCIREDNGRRRAEHPHPPSSRGQALTFPYQGGRARLIALKLPVGIRAPTPPLRLPASPSPPRC